MKNDNLRKIDSKDDINNNGNDPSLVYIFWLKIALGMVGGISYYFIQRVLFYIRGFSTLFPLQYLFVMLVFIVYSSIIYLMLIFIIYISKKKFGKMIPPTTRIWKVSTRYTFLFFAVFFISASITYYIGF
ncbi:MAG: hypothetical protein ACFFEN_02600 [Candidatus Thorarchaeota archaeon]